MSGIVQRLVLETDTHQQLVAAIGILLVWNRHGAKFYATGTDVNGKPFLSFLWGKPDGANDVLPLIAPMAEPDAIAMQAQAWLKTVDYGTEPDHDGDNHCGFHLRNRGPALHEPGSWKHNPWDFYAICTIQPCWVEYHK